MSADSFAVILVYSTSHALRIEKLLKESNIPSKLIPVPRRLSSDCGVCVRIEKFVKEATIRILEGSHIDIQGIYDL